MIFQRRADQFRLNFYQFLHLQDSEKQRRNYKVILSARPVLNVSMFTETEVCQEHQVLAEKLIFLFFLFSCSADNIRLSLAKHHPGSLVFTPRFKIIKLTIMP